MTLVDSSVWIDYFNGLVNPETDRLDQLLASEPVLVGDLMLVEVLQGFDADQDFLRARDLLTALAVVPLVDPSVALQAANYYRTLRSMCITIRKTIDTLIATHCLIHDRPLLYRDRDFDPFVRHLGLRSATVEAKLQ